MHRQILFIADDFGLGPEINAAILRAHTAGTLHGTALMMGQPGTEAAVEIARAHPGLPIGWHLHLNDSQPATLPRWPWGNSPARAGISIACSRKSRELMRREIARQWDLFRATGLPCAFINSHHHLHAHPAVFRALTEIVGPDFHGWIRLGRVRFFSPRPWLSTASSAIDLLFQRGRKLSTWPSSDTLWGLDRTFAMSAREVRAAIASLPAGRHEFIFHPRTLSCPDTQCLLDLRSSPTS